MALKLPIRLGAILGVPCPRQQLLPYYYRLRDAESGITNYETMRVALCDI